MILEHFTQENLCGGSGAKMLDAFISTESNIQYFILNNAYLHLLVYLAHEIRYLLELSVDMLALRSALIETENNRCVIFCIL